jgi:hypothetical protein
VGAHDDK